MECHRLEVLHDGGKVKLVAGARKTSEPHTFETVMGFEMSKAHLNALACQFDGATALGFCASSICRR